jgi:DNA polymerase III alpha subunit
VVEGLGKDPGALSRMVLLVQGRGQGYLNLSELLARAWTQNIVKAQAVVQLEWLKELSEGLILLSGAQAGPVGQALVQGDAVRATTWRCNWPRSFRTGSTWSCSAPAAPTTRCMWPARCNWRRG